MSAFTCRSSSTPGADLEELFRRLIFNLLVDNSDDHLKNHGVLLAGNGRYQLSPAFDIVPQLFQATGRDYRHTAVLRVLNVANGKKTKKANIGQQGLRQQESGARRSGREDRSVKRINRLAQDFKLMNALPSLCHELYK